MIVDLFRILNSLLIVLGCVYLQACAPGLLNAAGQDMGLEKCSSRSWIMQQRGKQSFQDNAANKIVFFRLDIRRKGLSFFARFNDKKLNLVLNTTF